MEFLTKLKKNMKIIKIRFNWRQTNNEITAFHEFDEVQIQKEFNGKLVDYISEHVCQGEGDKWYYDIYFADSTTQRVFNVSEVFYGPCKNVF